MGRGFVESNMLNLKELPGIPKRDSLFDGQGENDNLAEIIYEK